MPVLYPQNTPLLVHVFVECLLIEPVWQFKFANTKAALEKAGVHYYIDLKPPNNRTCDVHNFVDSKKY